VNGIRLIDDFGHHPTAIREALTALRRRYPEKRLWAIFEPRSNTSQRKVFQHALPEALAIADGILIASLHRPDKIPFEDRLDVRQVVEDLKSRGRLAFQEADADAIVERIRGQVSAGDTIVVLSNGGFDGIHQKLLTRLA
jgi:UDP-N-acetylmuramate: L-alanyl-gamma-D-glutamyl-meso-diaminopimelate ligase